MAHPRSLLQLSALGSDEVRDLLGTVRRARERALPELESAATVALLCARPLPFLRSAVEGGAALLGLRVSVYGPAEVSAMGDAGLAGSRLSQTHPLLVAAGLPPGWLAQLGEAPVPVLNAGDAEGDPIGALADLALLDRWCGGLAGRRWAWVGDTCGLFYDLLCVGGGLGLSSAVAHPVGFAPEPERLTLARERAAETGAAVLLTQDLAEALDEASVLYVDLWPQDHAERFRPYAIQRHHLRAARSSVRVLHRRPEHRGPELSASFAEEVAHAAEQQHAARVDAAAALLWRALRADPLGSVLPRAGRPTRG